MSQEPVDPAGCKRTGHLAHTYANGDTFLGQWVDGKREGQGILRLKRDHAVYTGQWKNDHRRVPDPSCPITCSSRESGKGACRMAT